MAKAPMRVAVTGAAGQIGYSLLFRIANGDLLGKDQPVILQLLEIDNEKAQNALKGVIMEIDDCAFPLLAGVSASLTNSWRIIFSASAVFSGEQAMYAPNVPVPRPSIWIGLTE